ncbi:MAG: hypothetical protein ACREH8_07370 [Opitutaceae bacterium]
MKTRVGKVSVAAALVCITPLLSTAQNTALHGSSSLAPASPGSVNRGIGRLTLLPGPTLLSPARTTPTMMPSPMKLAAAPAFRFVPATERILSGGPVSLRLIERPIVDPASRSGQLREPRDAKHPPAELLRFDSTLKSPPAQLQIRSVPRPAASVKGQIR